MVQELSNEPKMKIVPKKFVEIQPGVQEYGCQPLLENIIGKVSTKTLFQIPSELL